ncbi:MAG TPA: hypothetical protein H9687_05975 [Firmicutes bacterium]|nr:hypothetical protein [Bacillota bacterium]
MVLNRQINPPPFPCEKIVSDSFGSIFSNLFAKEIDRFYSFFHFYFLFFTSTFPFLCYPRGKPMYQRVKGRAYTMTLGISGKKRLDLPIFLDKLGSIPLDFSKKTKYNDC